MFFLFRKKKLTFIHPDVCDNYGGKRNKVVNPFTEYVQSAYNNPFPGVFTTTPHYFITVVIKTSLVLL